MLPLQTRILAESNSPKLLATLARTFFQSYCNYIASDIVNPQQEQKIFFNLGCFVNELSKLKLGCTSRRVGLKKD